MNVIANASARSSGIQHQVPASGFRQGHHHLYGAKSQIQSTGVASTGLPYMRLAAFEETLPDERLAQQQLHILLGPVLGWQRLKEHHDFLEVHALELLGPFDEEGGAYV